MKFEKLLQSHYKDFAEMVYTKSFPEDERREFPLIIELLSSKKEIFEFYTLVQKSSNNPVGILSLWNFESFCYIEHFAIEKSLRGKSLGSKALKQLMQKIDKPIVLEVEPPTTFDAAKRIEFYTKFGFRIIDKEYIQPPYSKDKSSLKMKIMTNNNLIEKEISFENIVKILYKEVYNQVL
ncbi:MAG: family acetyltransferase [Bacteroidetes bacterium]|nr:family acetyltransferase [Bacteroidota bacterium]